MKNKFKSIVILLSWCACLVGATTVFSQNKTQEINVGIVTFLSGPAAVPFGIPSRNAADIVIEAINNGTVPIPYSSKGLAGVKIKPIFIDENSKNKVKDYNDLIQAKGADIVVGYISSGDCKKISPIAEKAQVLTILAICGTPQIFEEVNTSPNYVFRTISHATMENVAAARYVVETKKGISSVAGINQNYAFGQDSWRDFSSSIAMLEKNAQVSAELFPKLFAGEYESEISMLSQKKPQIVHSSFWGNDVEALVIQGGVKGLFSRSLLVLTVGDTTMQRLGPQIPNGTIIGGRGTTGQFAPESELNEWFKKAYFQRFGSFPTSPAYHMAQAIFGVKAAADKSRSADPNAIKAALKGLAFETPSGTVSMSLSKGHQAIAAGAYGSYQYNPKTGKGTLVNIKRYSPACVNPPKGVKSTTWIKSGFKGAKCNP